MEEKNLENIKTENLPEPEIAGANATNYTVTMAATASATVTKTSGGSATSFYKYTVSENTITLVHSGVISDSKVVYTATPEASFTGWYIDGVRISGTGTISKAITITADCGTKYTVTLKASPTGSGSVSTTSLSVKYGTIYYISTSTASNLYVGSTPITATANSGYKFLKWSASTSSQYITSDKTIYAYFGKLYTVTTAASPTEGGTVTSGGTYVAGTSITLTATKNTGYSFNSWTVFDGEKFTTYTEEQIDLTVDSDLTCTAKFTAATYRISYNSNAHGTAPAAQTKTYGKDLTLHVFMDNDTSTGVVGTATFDANGGTTTKTSGQNIKTTTYTQTYWNTKADGSGTNYSSGGTYSDNKAATMYAIWSSTDSYSKITFPTTTECTRANYDLLGFATSETATTAQYSPGASYDIHTTTTYYAVWSIKTYTVTFKSGNNGTIVTKDTSGTVLSDNKITNVAHGTGLSGAGSTTYVKVTGYGTCTAIPNEGYSVSTWTDSGHDQAVESDRTFTVNFVLKTYSIKYKPGSYARETVEYTDTKTHGVALIMRGLTYSRVGYTQTGWSLKIDGSDLDYELDDLYTINSDQTFYPYWEINTYDITTSVYPSGGGTIAISPATWPYKYGSKVTVTATASSYYEFDKFTIDSESETRSTNTNPYTFKVYEDANVTAEFNDLKRTITYYVNNSSYGTLSDSTSYIDKGNTITVNSNRIWTESHGSTTIRTAYINSQKPKTTFVKWCYGTPTDLGDEVKTGDVITADTNITAIFELADLSGFVWTDDDSTKIVEGQKIKNITAAKWNELGILINECEYRAFGKNKMTTFDTVSSGDVIYAKYFNAYRDAIETLLNKYCSYHVCNKVSAMSGIKACYFNGYKDEDDPLNTMSLKVGINWVVYFINIS